MGLLGEKYLVPCEKRLVPDLRRLRTKRGTRVIWAPDLRRLRKNAAK